MKLRDKRFLKFEAMMALAAVVASLTLTIVMDKPIATFWASSLIMIAEFAFGSTLSWKFLGNDKQTCFWLRLSLLTTVFTVIFWVLVIALSLLMYGLDVFFMLGFICVGLVVLVIFPLPIIILATYIYCKFLHKGKGETAQDDETEIEDKR